MALRPSVVLIAGSWGGSLGSDGDAATIHAISSTATQMEGYAKSVVVIGDPPEQSQQPVDCLLGQQANMGRCSSVPPAEQATLTSEIAAGSKATRVGFIDTAGWFCFQNRCPMVIGHTIAFFDPSHVTQAYALELGSAFRAAFRQAAPAATKSPQ